MKSKPFLKIFLRSVQGPLQSTEGMAILIPRKREGNPTGCAMAHKDVLVHMFSTLTSVEIASIRRILRGKKLELFNEMLSRKRYFQFGLGEEFASLSPSNFGVLRWGLSAEMSAILAARRERDSIREQIRKYCLKASTFQAKGKAGRAIAQLDRAIILARQGEDLAELQRLLCSRLLLLDDPDDPEALEEVAAVGIAIVQINEVSRILALGRASKRDDEARREAVLVKMEEDLRHFDANGSGKMKVFISRGHAFVCIFRGRLEEALDHLHAAHNELIHNPAMMEDPMLMDSAIAVERARSSLMVQLHTASLALEGLREFMEVAPLWNVVTMRTLVFQTRWLELRHAFDEKDWVEFDRHEAEMAKAERDGATAPGMREVAYVDTAGMLVSRQEFGRALRWYEIAYAGRKSISSLEALKAMALGKLCCHFSLRKWDAMESTVRSMRRLLLNRKATDPTLKVLTAACLTVAQNPQVRRTRLEGMRQWMETSLQEGQVIAAYSGFDLSMWIAYELSIPAKE